MVGIHHFTPLVPHPAATQQCDSFGAAFQNPKLSSFLGGSDAVTNSSKRSECVYGKDVLFGGGVLCGFRRARANTLTGGARRDRDSQSISLSLSLSRALASLGRRPLRVSSWQPVYPSPPLTPVGACAGAKTDDNSHTPLTFSRGMHKRVPRAGAPRHGRHRSMPHAQQPTPRLPTPHFRRARAGV